MYRRYESSPQRSRQSAPKQEVNTQPHNTNNHRTTSNANNKNNVNNNSGRAPQKAAPPVNHKNSCHNKNNASSKHITRFIPQSLYNPDTRKVLGFMDAEDLFIAALIILLIDSGSEDCDNTMLILALVYLLLSEHIDLPI